MPAFHVEESIEIDASPTHVYEAVADFGTWTKWSPWLCAEPTANVDVTGEPGAVGSCYSWLGEIVGQGEIEHLQMSPGKSIQDEIRFLKPFKSKSNVSFRFEGRGDDKTKMTWAMDGKLPWFMFWMKSMMTSMISMDYERGLKMLKEWIETGEIATKTTVRGVEEIGPLQVAGLRNQCSMENIDSTMAKTFTEAKQRLADNGLRNDGDVISVYHKFDAKARTFDFTAGFVVPSVSNADGLSTWSLPASKALSVGHCGSYEHLGNAWSAAYQHARYKKLKLSNLGTFEIYRNDPAETDRKDLLTDVYLPLK